MESMYDRASRERDGMLQTSSDSYMATLVWTGFMRRTLARVSLSAPDTTTEWME